MLSRQNNDLLTQTGPGTPMGELLRRYWIPALMSSEIPDPDGEPVKVRLLGENLIAYRDTDGNVGLVDEVCPHRGASLWYARNEDCGLRCIYHGWKIDATGAVVDTPNEETLLQVQTTAYPVYESGGLVWAYMGPPALVPPKRRFIWTDLPESQRVITKVWVEGNFLQGVEGGIDSSHVGFLHRQFDPSTWGGIGTAIRVKAPRLEVEQTAYGFRYAALRSLPDGRQNIRITPFILPFHTYVPTARADNNLWHAWVPRDDGSNWMYDVRFSTDGPFDLEGEHERIRGIGLNGDFRPERTLGNKHLQSREAMRTLNFSGIEGVKNQDYAIVETMGPIVDRTREHLGASDRAVAAARRLLLSALRSFQEGEEPPGLDPSIPLERVVGVDVTATAELDWRQACPLPAGAALPERETVALEEA
ncbi:MAG TPA: Rieske 2Fe-2S domain-containing protein [Dehalococcoidia bacterium]|nr:Rieske 2Fe-2S domain-containing protein [Dehalococcoidia bacterium]